MTKEQHLSVNDPKNELWRFPTPRLTTLMIVDLLSSFRLT